MHASENSRRSFLLSASRMLGGAWLVAHWPDIASAAHHADAAPSSNEPIKLEVLSAADATQVEAIAAQIIPSGATPGAQEAHALVFIDRALGSFFAFMAPSFREGLKEFTTAFDAKYPAAKGFAASSAADQQAYLSTVEQTTFFQTARLLTVLGFLASPKYGGNAGGIGWKAIGFDDAHLYQPPFGYYDREYTGFVPYETEKHT